jgi:selenocysteine-specific elongation factor
VAVNVSDVATADIERGLVLTRRDELPPTRVLDVELSLLAAAPEPLKKRSKLLLHLGTAQLEATVALIDAAELKPGDTALAQLRLGDQVAALPGQRFILRGFRALKGRGATLAGGKVLTIDAPKRKRGASTLLRPLVDATPDARLLWLIRQSGYRGSTPRALHARSALGTKVIARTLELAASRGQVLLIDKERRVYVAAEVLSALAERALHVLQDFHQREPLRPALNKEELRQRLGVESERLFARLLAALKPQVEGAGEGLRLRGVRSALTEGQQSAHQQLVSCLLAKGLAPPTVAELAQQLAMPPPRVVELLKVGVSRGEVVKVTDELYFSRSAVDDLKTRLGAYLREHREVSTQGFKELVGQSRKFVIPLSEFFDREKVTLRVGDKRVLRRG